MTAQSPSVEDLRKLATESPPELDQEIALAGVQRMARDRSHIALAIVYAFVGIISITLIYAGIAVLGHSWPTVRPVQQYAETLITSALLPVVTLVLGYYFGTQRDSN